MPQQGSGIATMQSSRQKTEPINNMNRQAESASVSISQLTSLTEPLIRQENDDRDGVFRDDTTHEDRISSNNLQRILFFTWCAFTGRSIWGQSVLSIFIYLLRRGNPESVGYLTAVMGISQVVASLMVKCLCQRRDTILRLASLIGLTAVAVTSIAILRLDYLLLIVALSLWGVMWGISDVPLATLFADSIPTEQHAHYYKRGSSLIRLGNFSGPLIALVVFFYLGDNWTLLNCWIVLEVGLAICVPAILVLCLLRDDISASHEDLPQTISFQESMEEKDDVLACSTSRERTQGADDEENPYEPFITDIDIGREENHRRLCCCRERSATPYLITLADMLSGIASGLSIRYFPVFFMDRLGITPTQVQIMYIVTPFGQAVFAKAAQRLAERYGPCRVSAVFQWTYVAVLISMVTCYVRGMPTTLVCVLYVVHSSLMNSTGSLSRTILLHALPQGDIGGWSFAETLGMFLWSTSAAFGGALVGYKGVVFVFYATAGLQLLASLPLLFLFSADRFIKVGADSGFLEGDNENDLSSIAMMNSEAEETIYEPSRDRLDSSDSEFFDCSSILPGSIRVNTVVNTGDRPMRRVAEYTNRQCVYEDGSPAYIQQGDSEDNVPSNYLAHCRGKRKQALELWKASQRWRAEKDVWKIHTKTNPWFAKIKDAYPHFIHGYTKTGYPVFYEQPGKMKLIELFKEGCQVSDMTTWYIFLMEYISNCVCTRPEIRSKLGLNLCTNELTSSSWGFVVVVDLKGAGVSILNRSVLSYMKQAAEINSTHYPSSMKRSLMVNAGPLASTVWSGVKKVVPAVVPCDILSAKQYLSVLRQYIDDDQIPPEYGGSSPFPIGQHPYEVDIENLMQDAMNGTMSTNGNETPVLTPVSSTGVESASSSWNSFSSETSPSGSRSSNGFSRESGSVTLPPDNELAGCPCDD